MVEDDPLEAGSPEISVVDRQSRIPIDPDAVRSLVQSVLAAEGVEASVEVAFVDDETIADLHLRFLDIPGPTDVITFPLEDDDEVHGGPRELGEVVVSTDTALRQGPEYGVDPLEEALLYVVHGVLHLLGHDDREEADAAHMAERQRALLDRWLEAGA